MSYKHNPGSLAKAYQQVKQLKADLVATLVLREEQGHYAEVTHEQWPSKRGGDDNRGGPWTWTTTEWIVDHPAEIVPDEGKRAAALVQLTQIATQSPWPSVQLLSATASHQADTQKFYDSFRRTLLGLAEDRPTTQGIELLREARYLYQDGCMQYEIAECYRQTRFLRTKLCARRALGYSFIRAFMDWVVQK